MPRLTENERKIATPPRRGRGVWWTWRPLGGAEINPRRVAASRTTRVAANETASENANSAKNKSGKISISFPRNSGISGLFAARSQPFFPLVAFRDANGCSRNYTTRYARRSILLSALGVGWHASHTPLRGWRRRRIHAE